MILLADLEANGLNPSVIHCIVVKEVGGERHTFTDMRSFEAYTAEHSEATWVFHNGLNYDVPVINKLTNIDISPSSVIDTQVVSKLRNYKQYNTHSLKEIGQDLGVFKGEYGGGWDICTPEMVAYCEQDVEVLEAIFEDQRSFIFDTDNKEALRVEHDTAWLCREMHDNGFPFLKDRALELLSSIKEEMKELEDSFKSIIEDQEVVDRTLKLRYNKDGTLNKRCAQAMVDAQSFSIDEENEQIVIYKQREFNPGSPKQCIDVLWEYGWKPTEKTKGHMKWERENK